MYRVFTRQLIPTRHHFATATSLVGRVELATYRYARVPRRNNYTLAEAFEIICRNRHAEREFSSKEVPGSTVRKIVELAQMAPSAFNIQPYKIVVVSSPEAKNSLATAMMEGNEGHVQTAAHTVIFAADKDPSRSTRKVMDLEENSGTDSSHLASPITPAPVIAASNEPWAVKNASFLAQQLMLAATAHGIRTLPMEGFDERRLAYVLGIDLDDYAIPVVVCLGHAASSDDALPHIASAVTIDTSKVDSSVTLLPSKVRFPIEEICYSNNFGEPFEF